MAAGLTNTLRQVGRATGVAVLGALDASRVTTATQRALAELPVPLDAVHRLTAAIASGAGTRVATEVPPAPPRRDNSSCPHRYGRRLNGVLLAAAAFALLGTVVGFAY